MTFNMKTGYNEIVELEELDHLISWDDKLVVRILLMLEDELKKDDRLRNQYRFEVIQYGFQGSYPVLGIEHSSEGLESISELVVDRFQMLKKAISLDQLIAFDLDNKNRIESLFAGFE